MENISLLPKEKAVHIHEVMGENVKTIFINVHICVPNNVHALKL